MAVTLVVSGPGAAAQGITLDQPRIVLGRGSHADVRLPSRIVSSLHAVIRTEGAETALLDEGSTNGTKVNGQPIPRGRRKVLRSSDVVTIGPYEIRVEITTTIPDPPERTGTLARRLLLGVLSAAGAEAAPPQVTVGTGRNAGQVIPFPPAPSRLVAGRGPECDITLDDPDCSRQHLEFARDAEGVLVRDLGSRNGVHVAGRRHLERRLRHGDEVVLGRSSLVFHDPMEELLRSFEVGVDETAPQDSPSASTPPPPAPEAMPTAPAEPAPATAPAARRGSATADWIVVGLAVVILAVSLAALLLVLRGGHAP